MLLFFRLTQIFFSMTGIFIYPDIMFDWGGGQEMREPIVTNFGMLPLFVTSLMILPDQKKFLPQIFTLKND